MGRMKRRAKKAVGGVSATSHAVSRLYKIEGRDKLGRVAPKRIQFDVSHESSFFEHFFDCGRGTQQEDEVFAPHFRCAVTTNNNEIERWIGLSTCSRYDGPGMTEFGRPILNLIFVLDKSGSMSSRFDGDPKANKSKIKVAQDAIMFLTTQFRPEDSFGIVTFDNKARLIHPLTKWKDTDVDDLRMKVTGINSSGGTVITAGMNMAQEMIEAARGGETSGSNRLFFFTDMQVSSSDGKSFTDLIASNAENGIFATIYGVGMDLKAEIYERISKTKGCNYGNVRTQAGFQEQVDQEFSYTVTPIAYDVSIDVVSDGHTFAHGYGSPEVRSVRPSETVRLSTVFPSYQDERGESRSGIILFKLSSNNDNAPIKIRTTWQDENGKPSEVVSEIQLPVEQKDEDGVSYFETAGMRKAVLLIKYTEFMSNYLAARVSSDVSKYERYRKEFPRFVAFFRREMGILGDETLKTEELKQLKELAEQDDIPLDDVVLPAGESYSEQKEADPIVPAAMATANKLNPKVEEWSVDDVGVWLKSLGGAYNQYVATFKNTGIAGKILLSLSQDDLQQLIPNSLHLKVVVENLSQIRPADEKPQIEGH